jgi:hypothetical protein
LAANPFSNRTRFALRCSIELIVELRKQLLLDLIMELPETKGPFGCFHRQLAKVLESKLERRSVDAVFHRAIAEDRFDRRPTQAS